MRYRILTPSYTFRCSLAFTVNMASAVYARLLEEWIEQLLFPFDRFHPAASDLTRGNAIFPQSAAIASNVHLPVWAEASLSM